jgi:hypothetical protein
MRVAAFAAKTAFGLGLLLLASWNLPLAVADCPGGCGSGQPSSSCCVVTAPDGTQQCFGGCSGSTPKACCPGEVHRRLRGGRQLLHKRRVHGRPDLPSNR